MSRGRLPIVVLLIASLLGAMVVRRKVVAHRDEFERQRGFTVNHEGRLSQMPSYALGLMLGGLRGPLAIMLWTSSENQKIDRNMEDFHTKVELIRLLQGDFPTVFLYESWNMAYNWSVQAANVSSKYAILLDAIQFDNRAEAESPDNINVVTQTHLLYFDKFGNAAERSYYSPRLREETRVPEDHVRLKFALDQKDAFPRAIRLAGADLYNLYPIERNEGNTKVAYLTIRKSVFDRMPADLLAKATITQLPYKAPQNTRNGMSETHAQLLDSQGRILPAFLQPLGDRPQTFTAADGSTLPYLKEFEPYPYGVSPFALAYNYVKRARWLMVNRSVHHVQLSDRVISSRPALSLMKWAEEESRRGRRCELDSLDIPIPPREEDLDLATTPVPLDHALRRGPLLDEALHSYSRVVQLSQAGLREFDAHITYDPSETNAWQSHMRVLESQVPYFQADVAYLRAMITTGDERQRNIDTARAQYSQAAEKWARLLFTYYSGDPTVGQCVPPGRHPAQLDKWTHDELVNSALQVGRQMAQLPVARQNDDIMEYCTYIDRCVQRMIFLDRGK